MLPSLTNVDRVELLRNISLFAGLHPADLVALSEEMAECRFRAGELIFSQGDVGADVYVVAEGHVNIFLPGEESRRVSLKDLTVREYFGELALFDDKPRSASALATTDILLYRLGRETLWSYLQHRPEAALAILRTMTERLRETNAMLTQRAAKNVVAEFESKLLWSDRLADKVAELNGSWAFILGLFGLTAIWVVVNLHGVFAQPFDPFPFVFFNLLLAILVALQGPLIVMSQNRQTLKDRAQAETDFRVNLKNEVNIETILREMAEFRAEVNDRLAVRERSD